MSVIPSIPTMIAPTTKIPMAVCGDCLDILPLLPDGSFDLVLCDLPYHITQNSWDCPIPLEDYIEVSGQQIALSTLRQILWVPAKRQLLANNEFKELLQLPMCEIVRYWKTHRQNGLWSNYTRLIKPHGAILLFGAGMFSAELMTTGRSLWRYNLIWEKTTPTGFLNANRMPLRAHEDILCFYKRLPIYNPQKTTGHVRKVSTAKHKRNCALSTNYGAYDLSTYDSTERYPTSVWKFSTDKQRSALHPTQKPVALCEELIKTYTNESALVLDNCAGSFTTAVACDNLKRNWVAIEKERTYFEIGLNRVNENRTLLGLDPVEAYSIHEKIGGISRAKSR